MISNFVSQKKEKGIQSSYMEVIEEYTVFSI